jgi:putative membrane protein
MFRYLAATVATLVLALPVAAQNPPPQASKPSAATISFVTKAGIGGKFEVDSSQMALQKAQSAEVKQFAQRMIADHTKAGNELKQTLQTNGIAPPDQLDAKHQATMSKLQKAQAGAQFERAYVEAQVASHNEAVALFRRYSKSGDHPQLKEFATKTLPTLEDHQKHVKGLKGVKTTQAR